MSRIRNQQDLGAAVLLAVVGVAGLWFGRAYEFGTASHMGPGFMPRLLSWGLILFGLAIGSRAVKLRPAEAKGPAVEPILWRATLLVLASIVSFAALISSAGLAAAAFAVTVLSSLGSSESRWKETLALGVFLTLFCVVVFVYALRQSIPVFGG